MSEERKMRIGGNGWGPLTHEVRATLNVEAVLRCDVCGESKLLTASLNAFDASLRDPNAYRSDVESAVRIALSNAAARFDYRVMRVSPVESKREDGDDVVTACPPCRERVKRALLTALRRA